MLSRVALGKVDFDSRNVSYSLSLKAQYRDFLAIYEVNVLEKCLYNTSVNSSSTHPPPP